MVVGCGECHRLLPKRSDTFDHNGITVHTIVTPQDCGICHPQVRGQYLQNKMTHARTNLLENETCQMFVHTVNGIQQKDPVLPVMPDMLSLLRLQGNPIPAVNVIRDRTYCDLTLQTAFVTITKL